MTYAIIDNGVVTGWSVQSLEKTYEKYPNSTIVEMTQDNGFAYVGGIWDGEVFHEPNFIKEDDVNE